MMSRILFLFRYAYRNVTKHIFRSLTLLLSITMLAFIILVAFSIDDAFTRGYSLYRYLGNENVDVEVTFDGNSPSHIVLSDKMAQIIEYVDYYGSFFNMDSTIDINGKAEYVNIISGTSSDLNPFINTDYDYIQYDEVFINSEIAQKYELKVGDKIKILVGKQLEEYKIAEIVNVHGIFGDKTIFVQKNAFIKKLSKDVLNTDLNFINSELYISNRICINLKENVDTTQFIELLETDEFYPTSLVRDPKNVDDYQPVLDIAVGMMYAAISIFIASMVFVLVSTINLRITNMRNEIGVIETLGESKKYMFKVLIIEMLSFAIVGLIIAWLVCKIIYRVEFFIFTDYANYNYPFTFLQIILTYLAICFVVLLCSLISYRKFKKMDTIQLSQSKRFEQVWSLKKLLILNIVCITVITLIILLKSYLHLKIYSLLMMIIVFITAIAVVSLLLKLILKFFNVNAIFKYSIGNNLSYNRTKHNSLRILLICLFGIVAAFCVIETIHKEINKVETNLNIDYALVNYTEYDKEMEEELLAHHAVEMVGPANFKQKVSTVYELYVFEIMFSCEVEKTKSFMNFELPLEIVEEFKNPTKNYIVVTHEFLKANDKRIGDSLSFKVGDEFITYQIIADCPVGFQLFAFTNDCYNEKIGTNSILINTTSDDPQVLNELNVFIRQKYNNNMTYVLNVAETINDMFSRGIMALNVIYVILGIVIASFIISIINNTILIFKETKRELATLQILGVSPHELDYLVVYEMIVSYLVVIIPVCLMLYAFFETFGGFSLLFGYYVDMQASLTSILMGSILGLLCFGLSYIYYFIGIRKINVCNELKK